MWLYVVSAILPFLVLFIKNVTKKFGANLTFLFLVVATFIIALLFNLGQSLLSPEVLSAWGKVASTQALVWAVLIKYLGSVISFPSKPTE